MIPSVLGFSALGYITTHATDLAVMNEAALVGSMIGAIVGTFVGLYVDHHRSEKAKKNTAA